MPKIASTRRWGLSLRDCPLLIDLLLTAVLALPLFAHGQQVQARIVMQSSPLAGFRHYEAPNLWGEIQPGDPLALVRESDNPHDRNAVRVEWRTFKLGYVPRAENSGVARQLDHGTPLVARVSKVELTRAPNKRIEFEIFVPQ